MLNDDTLTPGVISGYKTWQRSVRVAVLERKAWILAQAQGPNKNLAAPLAAIFIPELIHRQNKSHLELQSQLQKSGPNV